MNGVPSNAAMPEPFVRNRWHQVFDGFALTGRSRGEPVELTNNGGDGQHWADPKAITGQLS
jgi:hypothetical protein